MTESEYNAKVNEIKISSMNSLMKKIALNDLYLRYKAYKDSHVADSNGFSDDDRKRAELYKTSKMNEAIKLGLNPDEAKNMKLSQIMDFIVWKKGIDTRMDDSECTSDTSCE